MTLEGEVNRFLHRHPNWGALIVAAGAAGMVIVGGMLVDYVARTGPAFAVFLVVVAVILTGMVLAGNRHLS